MNLPRFRLCRSTLNLRTFNSANNVRTTWYFVHGILRLHLRALCQILGSQECWVYKLEWSPVLILSMIETGSGRIIQRISLDTLCRGSDVTLRPHHLYPVDTCYRYQPRSKLNLPKLKRRYLASGSGWTNCVTRIILLSYFDTPGVKGMVTDSETNETIEGAHVSILGRTVPPNPSSTTALGEYWKLLLAGTYDVQVCDKYDKTTPSMQPCIMA